MAQLVVVPRCCSWRHDAAMGIREAASERQRRHRRRAVECPAFRASTRALLGLTIWGQEEKDRKRRGCINAQNSHCAPSYMTAAGGATKCTHQTRAQSRRRRRGLQRPLRSPDVPGFALSLLPPAQGPPAALSDKCRDGPGQGTLGRRRPHGHHRACVRPGAF